MKHEIYNQNTNSIDIQNLILPYHNDIRSA